MLAFGQVCWRLSLLDELSPPLDQQNAVACCSDGGCIHAVRKLHRQKKIKAEEHTAVRVTQLASSSSITPLHERHSRASPHVHRIYLPQEEDRYCQQQEERNDSQKDDPPGNFCNVFLLPLKENCHLYLRVIWNGKGSDHDAWLLNDRNYWNCPQCSVLLHLCAVLLWFQRNVVWGVNEVECGIHYNVQVVQRTVVLLRGEMTQCRQLEKDRQELESTRINLGVFSQTHEDL